MSRIGWIRADTVMRVFWTSPRLRTRRPPAGVKIHKIGKRGFWGQKLPFPSAPEKRGLSQIIPISIQGSTRKMVIFWLKAPFSGALGNGSFLIEKPSFPAFAPHFYTGLHKENGDFFDSKRPFLVHWEMGVFWPRNPLFPILWILTLVGGRRIRNTKTLTANIPLN